jgi:phosphatidylglycerol---prolipoprotein diacylglyceryl transferase
VRPVLFHLEGWAVPTHDFFVALGVTVAALVFLREARSRGQLREETLVAVVGALVGGAIGMRLSGWVRHLDPAENAGLLDAWQYGARSVLGGLTGAYVGVLVAKRLIGYRESTGDLFAPAVALGMAVGRLGCFLTEPAGRPTSLPWGVHAPADVPGCAGCATGVAMHPSFLYEIAFHLAAFAALLWLKPRIGVPGELLTLYLAGYATFRFAVEFTRANEPVWLDLTRPQWFLVPCLALLAARLVQQRRRGAYDGVLGRARARSAA